MELKRHRSTSVSLIIPRVRSGRLLIPLFLAFYLILDVAVGGTNGWFPDGGDKPWLDGSQSMISIFRYQLWNVYWSYSVDAMGEFWKRKAEWLPSWPQTVEERALVMYVLISYGMQVNDTNRCETQWFRENVAKMLRPGCDFKWLNSSWTLYRTHLSHSLQTLFHTHMNDFQIPLFWH